jgi:tetratricopeptide (TPR) repeat protein
MTQAERGEGSCGTEVAKRNTDQPPPGPIFLDESNVLYDLDLREEALAAYEEAIQLAPQEAILHLHKGHALEQLGRLSEAQRSYEEARRLGYIG